VRRKPPAPSGGGATDDKREHIVSPLCSTRPGLWERVGDALDGPRPIHRETFVHRDYHPGNVLLIAADLLPTLISPMLRGGRDLTQFEDYLTQFEDYVEGVLDECQ
jgi:hypothetical protein